MTKKHSDLFKVYDVIYRFMQTIVDVEPRLKKSQLTLSATSESLGLGSLDWVDIITELENTFGIRLGNIDGLVNANIDKLLRACTQQMVQRGQLTAKQNDMIFERYPQVEQVLLSSQQAIDNNKTVVATNAKQNTK